MTEEQMRALLAEYMEPALEKITQQSVQIELLKQQIEAQRQSIQVVSIKNAAQQLGWSESALRQAIDAGEFKSGDEVTRKGTTGSYMVDVQAYLRRKKREQRKLRIC
ncbi:MAG: hypothetical protein ACFB14_08855 [Leptolyngbyaceae cyanobacterium]